MHGDIAPTSGDIGCDVGRARPARRPVQKRYQTAVGRPAGGATCMATSPRHQATCIGCDVGRARLARQLVQKRYQMAVGRPAGGRHGDIALTSGDIGCDVRAASPALGPMYRVPCAGPLPTSDLMPVRLLATSGPMFRPVPDIAPGVGLALCDIGSDILARPQHRTRRRFGPMRHRVRCSGPSSTSHPMSVWPYATSGPMFRPDLNIAPDVGLA